MLAEHNAHPSTTLQRHNASRSELDVFTFRVNSLDDASFLAMLSDPREGARARGAIFTVPVREHNIREYAGTGRTSVSVKEINLVIKTGGQSALVNLLHVLEDDTLRKIAQEDCISQVIEEDLCLSQRYAAIHRTPSLHSDRSKRTSLSPRYGSVTPPPFSL